MYVCMYVCFVSNIHKVHLSYDYHFLASYQPGDSLMDKSSSLSWQPVSCFSTCQSETTSTSSSSLSLSLFFFFNERI
jgi:hypothetical protein